MTQHFRQARFNLYNIQNFYKYKKLAELATKNLETLLAST